MPHSRKPDKAFARRQRAENLGYLVEKASHTSSVVAPLRVAHSTDAIANSLDDPQGALVSLDEKVSRILEKLEQQDSTLQKLLCNLPPSQPAACRPPLGYLSNVLSLDEASQVEKFVIELTSKRTSMTALRGPKVRADFEHDALHIATPPPGLDGGELPSESPALPVGQFNICTPRGGESKDVFDDSNSEKIDAMTDELPSASCIPEIVRSDNATKLTPSDTSIIATWDQAEWELPVKMTNTEETPPCTPARVALPSLPPALGILNGDVPCDDQIVLPCLPSFPFRADSLNECIASGGVLCGAQPQPWPLAATESSMNEDAIADDSRDMIATRTQILEVEHAKFLEIAISNAKFNIMDSLNTIESKIAAFGFEFCDDTSIFTVASRLAQTSSHRIAIQSLLDEGYLKLMPSALNMVCTKSNDLNDSALLHPLAFPADSFTRNCEASDTKLLKNLRTRDSGNFASNPIYFSSQCSSVANSEANELSPSVQQSATSIAAVKSQL